MSSSSVYQAQREAYRHKLMFELMFRDEEQVDLKRYIRAFVSVPGFDPLAPSPSRV